MEDTVFSSKEWQTAEIPSLSLTQILCGSLLQVAGRKIKCHCPIVKALWIRERDRRAETDGRTSWDERLPRISGAAGVVSCLVQAARRS